MAARPGGQLLLAGLPPETLLASKLQGPRLRPHLVPRPRLLQQLQQGLERTLILLSAPAGCGKSTLLAEWLASGALPFAWLALEPPDNEPAHFCSSLLAALQTTDPRLGGGCRAQAAPQPLHPPRVERLLTALLNELLARGSDEGDHVVLVLDDYHVITNEAIHAALRLLLEHRPPQLHLVLSTREDPPLPLARLRGRDALLELRAADLQFTPEESSTYLVERRGLPLSTEERALLHARTEGWITGLQLAALALQGRADPSGFIATFSGSHHYVADYLLDEVLSRQSAAIQDFLLQTSILERLSGPLCDAVRGQHDSQAQLGSLERANLFVVPLDDERRWYRYHHLFAQVLQQRLQHSAPSLIPELHRRASRWYEQQGDLVEALSHALAAPAFAEAARLLEQYSATCLAGSQLLTLLEWLHALPERLLLAPAALGLLQALALMDPEQWEKASARLQAVGQGMDLGEEAQGAQGRLFLGQVLGCWGVLAGVLGAARPPLGRAHRGAGRAGPGPGRTRGRHPPLPGGRPTDDDFAPRGPAAGADPSICRETAACCEQTGQDRFPAPSPPAQFARGTADGTRARRAAVAAGWGFQSRDCLSVDAQCEHRQETRLEYLWQTERAEAGSGHRQSAHAPSAVRAGEQWDASRCAFILRLCATRRFIALGLPLEGRALDGGRLHPFPRQKSPRNYSFWVLSCPPVVSYTP